MMGRRAGAAVVLGAAMILGGAACKSGGSGGAGGGSGGAGGGGGSAQQAPIVLPPSNGQSCQTGGEGSCTDQAQIDAYATCIVQACDAQYKQCFGDGYASGSFGGACADLMSCSAACQSCDQACLQACSDKDLTGACKDCIVGPIANCAIGAITGGTCKLPCVESTSGGACDDLQACCDSLSGAAQTECQTTHDQVSLGGDTACGAALTGYKASGQCP